MPPLGAHAISERLMPCGCRAWCSAHEVHIDEEQLAWFKRALGAAAGRPVVVFSHAPPQGCGLTVIQVGCWSDLSRSWGALPSPWCPNGCPGTAVSAQHRAEGFPSLKGSAKLRGWEMGSSHGLSVQCTWKADQEP